MTGLIKFVFKTNLVIASLMAFGLFFGLVSLIVAVPLMASALANSGALLVVSSKSNPKELVE